MTGLLLESRAARQRRLGGASLSVALHTAIIGAIVAGTATGRPATMPAPSEVHLVRFRYPAAERAVAPRSASAATVVVQRDVVVVPPTIVAPAIIPSGIPTIDLTHITRAIASDSAIGATSPTGHGQGLASGFDLTTDDGSRASEWTGTELLMRVVASRKPKYPESLRQAGVDGRVLVQFTVDTAGAVDLASVRILESTHELFTRAVRDVMSSFRFKPAVVGGRRVSSLAQMPFEFAISR